MYKTVHVKSNTLVLEPYFILTIHHPEMASKTLPGQFLMVSPYIKDQQKNQSLYLKRPISVFDVHKETGDILLYYQVQGEGTQNISTFKKDDQIEVMGPLGKGFRTLNIKNQKLLFVGAGVGIAPLKYLYDTLKQDNEIHLIFSGRNKAALKYTEAFKDTKHVYYSSDDGSIGEQANAIQMAEKVIIAQQENPFHLVYSCGPPVVLKNLGILLEKKGIPAQLSLEGRMGCGVRACQACTINTKMGPQKVCSFGPVFDLKNLKLEEL